MTTESSHPSPATGGRQSLFNRTSPGPSGSLLGRTPISRAHTNNASEGRQSPSPSAREATPTPKEDVKPKVTPNANTIAITVKDGNNTLGFKMRRDRSLEKLMIAACTSWGKNLKDCRFIFDGERIKLADTPDSLHMEDDDIVEMFTEQIGGQVFESSD